MCVCMYRNTYMWVYIHTYISTEQKAQKYTHTARPTCASIKLPQPYITINTTTSIKWCWGNRMSTYKTVRLDPYVHLDQKFIQNGQWWRVGWVSWMLAAAGLQKHEDRSIPGRVGKSEHPGSKRDYLTIEEEAQSRLLASTWTHTHNRHAYNILRV